MRRLLIPDAGPLFSLAAGKLLPLLANFNVAITDVVRDETINRASHPHASPEAQLLGAYFRENAPTIALFTTQVGSDQAAQRLLDPAYQPPRNLGELSIQSLLIDLRLKVPASNPVILFEDHWFLKNAVMLQKPCTLLSTQALLEFAERQGWIASAQLARRAIAKSRPTAYSASKTIGVRQLPDVYGEGNGSA